MAQRLSYSRELRAQTAGRRHSSKIDAEGMLLLIGETIDQFVSVPYVSAAGWRLFTMLLSARPGAESMAWRVKQHVVGTESLR